MLRRPRGFLVAAGVPVEVISLEVHLGREAKSDTFHAEFPMSGLPGGRDTAFWCDTPEIAVKVLIDDAPLFSGNVTTVRPNWRTGRIDVNGHDKSKGMQERKSLSEAFKNKKGKDIIEEVAKRHGLSLNLSADTMKAGRLYDIDTVHHPRELTDWDLIHALADAEGLSISLDGDTLHLGPEGEDELPVLDVFYAPPTPQDYATGNFIELSGVRNLDLTGKTTVKVSSHDHRTGKAISAKKTLAAATGLGKNGDGITYEYQAPGLKQDRATRIAEKRLRRATKQERSLVINVPGDTGIRARMATKLHGTGTSFDQKYDNESAEHRLNEEEGYRALVTVKGASQGREISDG